MTHAHQLALEIVGSNPTGTLYQNDKMDLYPGSPETEVFKNLPAVWEETKVLSGEVGKYIVVARRSGKQWFVGAITNTERQKLNINFDFLPAKKNYMAHLFSDDLQMQTRTQVKIITKTMSSQTVIQPELLPSGGLAIRLDPEEI